MTQEQQMSRMCIQRYSIFSTKEAFYLQHLTWYWFHLVSLHKKVLRGAQGYKEVWVLFVRRRIGSVSRRNANERLSGSGFTVDET